MSISPLQRQFVRERAGNCCEYCQLWAMRGVVPFHVDHIISLKHANEFPKLLVCLMLVALTTLFSLA